VRWDLTDEETCKKISKRIEVSYAKITGRQSGADDCAQEVIEYYLSGKGQKQTIDQAVIDYLRRDSGHKGQRGYSDRIAPKKQLCENLVAGDTGLNMEHRLNAKQIIGLSRHWERAVMSLKFLEGYGQAEIGDFFGVSDSRVSQCIERISVRISTRINSQESRAEAKRARAMEEILSQETKGNWGRMEQVSFERMEIGESWGMASFNEASF